MPLGIQKIQEIQDVLDAVGNSEISRKFRKSRISWMPWGIQKIQESSEHSGNRELFHVCHPQHNWCHPLFNLCHPKGKQCPTWVRVTHMGQLLLFRMTVNSPLPTQKNAILSAPKYQAKYIIQKSQKLHQAYTIYLPYYKLSKSRIKSLNIASKHKNRAKTV